MLRLNKLLTGLRKLLCHKWFTIIKIFHCFCDMASGIWKFQSMHNIFSSLTPSTVIIRIDQNLCYIQILQTIFDKLLKLCNDMCSVALWWTFLHKGKYYCLLNSEDLSLLQTCIGKHVQSQLLLGFCLMMLTY